MTKTEIAEAILKLLTAESTPTIEPAECLSPAETSPLVGEYVIVRCRDAGVHAGELVSASGRTCHLKNSRRLHYWKAAKECYLSGVARHGLGDDCNVGGHIDVTLTENCELIQCSEKARRSIDEYPTKAPS